MGNFLNCCCTICEEFVGEAPPVRCARMIKPSSTGAKNERIIELADGILFYYQEEARGAAHVPVDGKQVGVKILGCINLAHYNLDEPYGARHDKLVLRKKNMEILAKDKVLSKDHMTKLGNNAALIKEDPTYTFNVAPKGADFRNLWAGFILEHVNWAAFGIKDKMHKDVLTLQKDERRR